MVFVWTGNSRGKNLLAASQWPLQRNITTLYSTMTKQSENVSPCEETCFSPTSLSLGTCVYSSSMCKVSTPANERKCKRQEDDGLPGVREKRACVGTKGLAQPQQNTVSTSTSAHTATVPNMSMVTVQTNPKRVWNEGSVNRPPRYLHLFYWEGDAKHQPSCLNLGDTTTTATSTQQRAREPCSNVNNPR